MLQFGLGPLQPPLGDILKDFIFIQFTPLHLTISFYIWTPHLGGRMCFMYHIPLHFHFYNPSFPPFFHLHNSSLPLSFPCFIFLAAFRTECVQGRLLPLNCTHLSVSKPLGHTVKKRVAKVVVTAV